jgi:hypothetical protein
VPDVDRTSAVRVLQAQATALADSTDKLLVRVERLEVTITQERQQSDARLQVEVKAREALAIRFVAQVDTTRLRERERDARVTKTKVGVIAGAAALFGAACREYCDDVVRLIGGKR